LATVVRWDLVAIRQGMRSGNGEAQVLLKYLEATDPDRENIWANWTKKHPEMARIFWPAVRDTVLLERYDCLPEIFDTVRLQKDPAALKNALVSRIRGLLAEQSALPQAAKDHSSAKLLQQLELSYGVSEIELSTRQNVEASK
jgi:hypothetical protein